LIEIQKKNQIAKRNPSDSIIVFIHFNQVSTFFPTSAFQIEMLLETIKILPERLLKNNI
jgi:hypothetical protein